jgi:hypothetical protein
MLLKILNSQQQKHEIVKLDEIIIFYYCEIYFKFVKFHVIL